MGHAIGVIAAEKIAVGVVEDHRILGEVATSEGLSNLPAESVASLIYGLVEQACASAGADCGKIDAIGIGFPGIIRDGIVQDSPNLPQAKGLNLRQSMLGVLAGKHSQAPVLVLNDADAMAAGVAATMGHLEKTIRVWTLGNGIGFGRYPQTEGAGEGGHIVVTLDPKETYCGCGGVGHLEGIMGHRAMRLRFLDMEPEEVFAEAQAGDKRCCEFVRLWHRALAAATATSIHLDGPGKFFVSGPNSVYLETPLLSQFLHEMVKMSPLQGSVFEVIPTSQEIAIIGAAVNAGLARPVS